MNIINDIENKEFYKDIKKRGKIEKLEIKTIKD